MARVPDRLILRAIWPVVLAAIISLLPFTVYSTFVVSIADDTGTDEALVGTLRGLGGLAALVVGVALAPLIARWPAPRVTASALGVLSIACIVGSVSALDGTAGLPGLVVFCVGIGAATAMLTPALLRIATSAFADAGDSGRAATLVTATQSLAAVLAAPIIGVIGLAWGWHGALWVAAALAASAVILFLRKRPADAVTRRPLGYRESFQLLRRRRDLMALIAIAALRTSSFMGYLAFLAVRFHEQHGLDAVTFTLVWTLSGASFFAGNYLAGRWARAARARGPLLVGGLAAATAAVLVVFLTSSLAVSLIATVVMGFAHAVVSAQVTTLIAHRGEELITPAFSVNAAGMSLGVFAGAFFGGVGLSLAGSAGLAIALALPSVVALTLIRPALRARRISVATAQEL